MNIASQFLRVDGVSISTGTGREHATYATGHGGTLTHLDIPQLPRTETHSGAAGDLSGYTISPLLANPRHHEVRIWAAATGPNPAEAKSLLVDGCTNIKDRLRAVIVALETPANDVSFAGVAPQLVTTNMAEGLVSGDLTMPGETYTISHIIARTIHEQEPDIAYVAGDWTKHLNVAIVTIRAPRDVRGICVRAARAAFEAFDKIRAAVLDTSG